MLTLEELSNPREYEEICGDIEEELEASRPTRARARCTRGWCNQADAERYE